MSRRRQIAYVKALILPPTAPPVYSPDALEHVRQSLTKELNFGHGAKGAVLERERVNMDSESHSDESSNPEIPEWPPSDSDDEDADHLPANSIFTLVPSMQRYRNNLTALSQKYNLYFTAYRSSIYAYVPRSVPRQTIPRDPDVHVYTYAHAGATAGGEIDDTTPHSINHLVVGMLGTQEIVVITHDDGNVTAFYTKDFAEYIRCSRSNAPSANTMAPARKTPRKRRELRLRASSRMKMPKPFFEESVGISAWGIAIHQQSRLIAISSNRHEVMVFAPALVATGPQAQTCDCLSCCQGLEERVRRRARNWRIVVALGPEASNVPNISFVDDEHGNAERISAIDIRGNMWLADIWKPHQAPMRVMPSSGQLLMSEEFLPAPSRGWGILALANEYFLTVHSEEELLGAPLKNLEVVPKVKAAWHPTVNINQSKLGAPSNSSTQPPRRPAASTSASNDTGAFADLMDEDDGDEDVHGAIDDYSGGDYSDYLNEVVYGPNIDDDIFFQDVFNAGDVDDNDDDDDDDDEGSWVTSSDGDESDHDQGNEDAAEQGQNNINSNGNGTSTGNNAGTGTPHLNLSALADPYESPYDLSQSPLDESEESFSDFDSHGELNLPTIMANLPISDGALMQLEDIWANLFQQPVAESHYSSSIDNTGETIYGWSAPDPPWQFCQKTPERDDRAYQDMMYMPHTGEACASPKNLWDLRSFLKRPIQYNELHRGPCPKETKLSNRYHMIRTYEREFEMQPLDENPSPESGSLHEFGVLCPKILTMAFPPGSDVRHHFRSTNRLSMVVHIPELFLIVMGSPTGRVILVTPTRLRQPIRKPDGILHYGLRVDWVLPHGSEDAVIRNDSRPLHGMAVGPVQEYGLMGDDGVAKQRGIAAAAAAKPRRYRLMMHYRNHDILTYELSREEETGKVCIF
ncbi:hypothetical protein E4U13_001300 [Claviceps humidiphila]|uniref:Crt10 protein n=1 Tax=Claviceps humidiphila TaxID=1294629 RepID=A0A9P7TWZ5_9HYPO|nr:hypothetical protein E4U13_001300 [Claviceps humidiphila]